MCRETRGGACNVVASALAWMSEEKHSPARTAQPLRVWK